mgnify:FL=1
MAKAAGNRLGCLDSRTVMREDMTHPAGPATAEGEEPLGRLARRLYAAQYRSKRRETHSKFHKNMRMRFPLANNLQRA